MNLYARRGRRDLSDRREKESKEEEAESRSHKRYGVAHRLNVKKSEKKKEEGERSVNEERYDLYVWSAKARLGNFEFELTNTTHFCSLA